MSEKKTQVTMEMQLSNESFSSYPYIEKECKVASFRLILLNHSFGDFIADGISLVLSPNNKDHSKPILRLKVESDRPREETEGYVKSLMDDFKKLYTDTMELMLDKACAKPSECIKPHCCEERFNTTYVKVYTIPAIEDLIA